MKSRDGITTPVWKRNVEQPKFRSPPKKMQADVCVIGAGIAGLTTAYLLASEGKSVVVLDEGPIGGGQTERTSAHLASALDDRFFEIERLLGQESAKLGYESHAAAIDTIQRIARKEKIACDFKRVGGFLFPAPGQSEKELNKELAAAKRAGFVGVEKVAGPMIRFPHQARFHPLKYLYGLAEACRKLGAKIYIGQRVTDVQGADPRKNKKAEATLQGGAKARADAIVVATNTPAPINDWMGIYLKQSSFRTYVIGVEIAKGQVDDALYWDMADPYHYVRCEGKMLIVGGEDHKTGQFPESAAPFLKLLSWTKQRYPQVGEVKFRWSGQVQEPDDGMAFIGRAPTKGENVFVITGDSGMGLTHGTLGGLLITDLIMGRPNPWEKLYDPSRKQLNSEFVKENANAVAQYADFITPGETDDVREIRPGEGAVMRQGLKKIAVYRDPKGEVHKCSAICTHLQCIVQWNHVEKTWDCPCHGSRFDPVGKVLMGPAVTDLPRT